MIAARPLVRNLRPAAINLAKATPDLTSTFTVLNHLFNMLGYSPGGGQHGYLWWLAWLDHNARTLFSVQDADGVFRPLFIQLSCAELARIATFAPPVVGVLNLAPVQSICNSLGLGASKDQRHRQRHRGCGRRPRDAGGAASEGDLDREGTLMETGTPSSAGSITMVLFALSCAGLLLFLWLSFGGTIPFNPQGYRIKVSFPNAGQLGTQADVRIAGVSVGKVVGKSLDANGNRTLATMEIDRKFAPIHRDARAILRQKTIIGETYVELSSGHPRQPEAARRRDARPRPGPARGPARPGLQHLRSDDPPRLPGLAAGARQGAPGQRPEPQQRARQPADVRGRRDDILRVLDIEHSAVVSLVQNGGTVFAALGQNQAALRNLITSARRDLRHHRGQQHRPRADVQGVPDVPQREPGDVRPAEELRARHRSGDPGAQPRRSSSSSRRCSRCARCRPTCATSSPTSAR